MTMVFFVMSMVMVDNLVMVFIVMVKRNVYVVLLHVVMSVMTMVGMHVVRNGDGYESRSYGCTQQGSSGEFLKPESRGGMVEG